MKYFNSKVGYVDFRDLIFLGKQRLSAIFRGQWISGLKNRFEVVSRMQQNKTQSTVCLPARTTDSVYCTVSAYCDTTVYIDKLEFRPIQIKIKILVSVCEEEQVKGANKYIHVSYAISKLHAVLIACFIFLPLFHLDLTQLSNKNPVKCLCVSESWSK